jgi:hypothetical protein
MGCKLEDDPIFFTIAGVARDRRIEIGDESARSRVRCGFVLRRPRKLGRRTRPRTTNEALLRGAGLDAAGKRQRRITNRRPN